MDLEGRVRILEEQVQILLEWKRGQEEYHRRINTGIIKMRQWEDHTKQCHDTNCDCKTMTLEEWVKREDV